ncbi:hypothetical protein DU505_13705 [Billgrantia montanilacus]|uniref:Uncharacterized protein n=1 Tax=Billgrantia montanilacus TaxID=2282305 RepID=A0A368TUB4_9GAMM|nr:hypothetical protein DU505_13705 [Halomonas montanilacus]
MLDPESLRIEGQGSKIVGAFIVSHEDEKKAVPFEFPNPTNLPITSLGETEFPHIHLRFIAGGVVPIQLRLHDVVRFCQVELAGAANLKVEYIGQSFGDNGSSDALQRLIGKTGKQGHGSFQKVLADLSDRYPDSESHVLLYSYEQYKNYMFMGGGVPAVNNFESGEDRLDRLMNAEYTRENRIDLIEAGLIRYFQPAYNDIYKKTFPRESHAMLQSLFEADVTGLAISLSTLEHSISVYSDQVSPSAMHCAQFPIVDDAARASFLDLAML